MEIKDRKIGGISAKSKIWKGDKDRPWKIKKTRVEKRG